MSQSSYFSRSAGSVDLVCVPSTIFQREWERRYIIAIEHQERYPVPSVKQGMLSSLNCIGCERSSEGGREALPDPELEEEDSAIVKAQEKISDTKNTKVGG